MNLDQEKHVAREGEVSMGSSGLEVKPIYFLNAADMGWDARKTKQVRTETAECQGDGGCFTYC